MDRYDKNEHQEKAVQISEEDAHRAKLLKLAEHRTVALGEFMSAQVAKEIEYDKYVLAQVALKNATDWEEQLRIAYKDTDMVFQVAWEKPHGHRNHRSPALNKRWARPMSTGDGARFLPWGWGCPTLGYPKT